jgi:hypothetical protein
MDEYNKMDIKALSRFLAYLYIDNAAKAIILLALINTQRVSPSQTMFSVIVGSM